MRLNVVGDDFFAAEIHRIRGSGELDWRQNHQDIRYEACEVPDGVAHAVGQFMRDLGLTFGALDFGVDAAGVWWFYEVNANGQWLWIEHQTRLPISGALAGLLKEPS